MPVETTYLAAFMVGLLGGVHCIGMCGGIVAALTMGSAPRQGSPWRYLLAYNLGRITSYTAAGLVIGGLGAQLSDMHELQLGLKIMAGLFMVAMGLYLAGWWFGLSHLEQLGSIAWRRIQPLGNRFIPVASSFQAAILGLLWGWLPCGLVYSVLIWSLSAQGMIEGGLLMLSFGLGTLPNLLALGLFAAGLKKWIQHRRVKVIAGMLVMAFGVIQLYQVFISIRV